MSVDVDASQVRALVSDLGKVSGRVEPEVEAVVKRAALNVKNALRAGAKESKWFRRIEPAITFDRHLGLGLRTVAYEVGPRVGVAQGSLGGVAYFGGANGGGGTLDLDGPLDAEEPKMLSYLGQALEKATGL